MGSAKKSVPMIWKALSSETVFKRTVKFGFASQEDTEVCAKFKVKKFPTVLMQRGAKAEEKETYTGEMKFQALMEWMWMDLALEAAYKDLFDPAMLPSAVVFNPHKRLRFTKLDHGEDNEVQGNEVSIANLMDKVLGGDARFKMVPGQKLPGWAARDAKKTEL